MLYRFISNIAQQHLFPTDQEVLLAVSGGVDSVVLTHLMHVAGYPFSIAHCNFHLRPDECDRDEVFVRQLATTYGVVCHVVHFDTNSIAQDSHLGIEGTARKLRYDWFGKLCCEQGFPAVLTAHHRDDAVETFFINLLRGTGLTGLHGILPVQGHVVRPLLFAGREEILRYAAENHLSFVEDSTNASLDYRRNQIRHQLMPLLRQLQPAAATTISNTINNLQAVERLYLHLLEPLRHDYVQEDGDTIRVRVADLMPDDGQLLFELLRPYGFNIQVVEDILASRQSGLRFASPSFQAYLDRGVLVLTPLSRQLDTPAMLASERVFCIDQRIVTPENFFTENLDLKHLPNATACFDADTIHGLLHLRHWQEGDRFQPLGMQHGTQLVSDYFSDHKYSPSDKIHQLLLVDDDDHILWIVNHRTAHPFRVTPTTKRILIVRLSVAGDLN